MPLTNEELFTFLNEFQTNIGTAIDKLRADQSQSVHKKERLIELYGKLSAVTTVKRFMDCSLTSNDCDTDLKFFNDWIDEKQSESESDSKSKF